MQPLIKRTLKPVYDVEKHLSHSYIRSHNKIILQTPKMAFGHEMHEYLLNRNEQKNYDQTVINECNNFYKSFEKKLGSQFIDFKKDYNCEQTIYAELVHSEKNNEDPLPFKGIIDMYSQPLNILYDLKITQKYNEKSTQYLGYDKQINTYLNLAGVGIGHLLFFDLTTKKIIVSLPYFRQDDNEYFDGIYNKFYDKFY